MSTIASDGCQISILNHDIIYGYSSSYPTATSNAIILCYCNVNLGSFMSKAHAQLTVQKSSSRRSDKIPVYYWQ